MDGQVGSSFVGKIKHIWWATMSSWGYLETEKRTADARKAALHRMMHMELDHHLMVRS